MTYSDEEHRIEVVLAHGAMMDEATAFRRIAELGPEEAPAYRTAWQSAPEAAALELAQLIVEFREQLPAERRELLTTIGAGLIEAGTQIERFVASQEEE